MCSCVHTNQGTTNFFNTFVGVQQGAVLSPVLFTLYLNDLNQCLSDVYGVYLNGTYIKAILYADDICLVSNSAEGLQSHITKLYRYCSTWKLSVNLKKNKILICRGGGPIAKKEQWRWGNKPIEICSMYK